MAINKIEMQDVNGNVLYPHTTGDLVNYDTAKTVNQKIDEAIANLTSLKAGLATAVNNKTGSSLTSDSTLADITSKINQIVTLSSGTADANATAANILAGSTAYVKGNKVTGTMTNQGAKTSSLNCGASYTIPAGYHNGSGKITANSLASQTSATATAGQILANQTAYVNGSKVTGSMPSMTNIGSGHANATGVEIGTYTAGDSNMYMYLGIPAYTYTADNTWVRYLASNVASKIGLTADKIVSGNNIMGVIGAATASSLGGVKVQTGSTTAVCSGSGEGSFKYSITGLGFTPRVIIVTATDGSQKTFATVINQNYYTNIIPINSQDRAAFFVMYDSSGANPTGAATANTTYYNEFGNGFYNGHMMACSRNTKTWTIEYLAIG